MNRTPRNISLNGFTLVELMIVVSILGILAALVIPKFTNASEMAQVSSTKDQLRLLRIALERYKLDHSDSYPAIGTIWDGLAGKTDLDGTSNATGDYGPYLKQPATNPFTDSSTVVAAGAGTATDGWEYDTTTSRNITAVGFNENTDIFTSP
jgi:general secretion pathway protein G